MAPLYEGYGIAGSKKQSTTPNTPAPASTFAGVNTSATGSVSSTKPFWADAWNTNFGNQKAQEDYFYRTGQAAPTFPNQGTPMRPVPPVNRGTPMRPVAPAILNRNNNLPVAAPPPAPANRRESDAYRYEGYGQDGVKNPATNTTTAEQTVAEPDWSQLPALTPEQQRAYRQGMRLANREYESEMNQVRYERRGARRDYRQGVRQANRQQFGGSEDLATALAYLGLDTSPATMGVGLQDLERQGDLARAGLAATKADTLAGLEARVLDSEIRKNRDKARIRQQKADQQAASATNLKRYFEENMQ